jgi:hypothetical protein
MSAMTFGKIGRERLETVREEPKPEKPLDAVWIVLEAANDLGDDATVEVCRRVIDASLNGRAAAPSDMHIVVEYFR